MYVASLTLSNFRNIKQAEMTYSPTANILLGDNGQGKTNVLESLFVVSQVRSHRTRDDRELVHHDETLAVIQAVVRSSVQSNLSKTIRLEFQQKSVAGSARCRVYVNGLALPNRSHLMGVLPSVGFFFKDLNLMRGAPADRRNWLDAAIAQYDIRHLDALRDFEKVRRQKAELLRKAPYPLSDSWSEQLMVWNEQFARHAAVLVQSRLTYLREILPDAQYRFEAFTEGCAEQMNLTYAATFDEDNVLAADSSVEMLTEQLMTRLTQKVTEEAARRTCVVGPHRDQLLFTINGKDAVQFASQGQQRSLILALKMAEVSRLTQRYGEAPVLLLDDVMAELDVYRQSQLIAQCPPDAQVILTTTHLPTLNNGCVDRPLWQEVKAFYIKEGVIRQQQEEEPHDEVAV